MPPVITAREQLKTFVEELPDELLQDAIHALNHLVDDEPLSEQEIEDLQSAHEDIKQGRMISLKDYEQQRGL